MRAIVPFLTKHADNPNYIQRMVFELDWFNLIGNDKWSFCEAGVCDVFDLPRGGDVPDCVPRDVFDHNPFEEALS